MSVVDDVGGDEYVVGRTSGRGEVVRTVRLARGGIGTGDGRRAGGRARCTCSRRGGPRDGQRPRGRQGPPRHRLFRRHRRDRRLAGVHDVGRRERRAQEPRGDIADPGLVVVRREIMIVVVIAECRPRGGGRDRHPPPGICRYFRLRRRRRRGSRRDLRGLRCREVFEAEDVEGGRRRRRARRHPRRDELLWLSPRVCFAFCDEGKIFFVKSMFQDTEVTSVLTFEASVVHFEVLRSPWARVATAEDGGQ